MSASYDMSGLFSISCGLYLVCSEHEGRNYGLLANTVMQVTSKPEMISVSINQASCTHGIIRKCDKFSVSVLGEDAPLEFIRRFGFRSCRDFDKFDDVKWSRGATGCPVVADHAVSVFEAFVKHAVDLGRHTLFVGEILAGAKLSDATPMTYDYYRNVKKGKTSRNAPTYQG